MSDLTLVTELIIYVANGLISNLDLFCISEAIFDARAFKFDRNVVVTRT